MTSKPEQRFYCVYYTTPHMNPEMDGDTISFFDEVDCTDDELMVIVAGKHPHWRVSRIRRNLSVNQMYAVNEGRI